MPRRVANIGVLLCRAATARELVARTKSEIDDEGLRKDLVELIETVIIYKLPRLSREEIQAMLQVHDIRETKVFQEAKEEGIEEERQRSLEEKRRGVARLAAMKMSAEKIAEILELDIDMVRTEMARVEG